MADPSGRERQRRRRQMHPHDVARRGVVDGVEVLAAGQERAEPAQVRWLADAARRPRRRDRARPPSRPRRCAAMPGAAARRHARRSATRRPPRTGRAPPGSGRCGRRRPTRMLSTDTPSTASTSAVSREIRLSSGSETISSSIARPAPCSRISIASTSPRTAPIRLATWPSAPGRSGIQTRTTTVITRPQGTVATSRAE